MCLLYAGAFPDKVKRMVLLESLGPFARADEEVPEIFAERLKGQRLRRDPVSITNRWKLPPKRCRKLSLLFPIMPRCTWPARNQLQGR